MHSQSDSSYLTMELKVRNLEALKSRCESNPHGANPAYIFSIETELKHAITSRDAAPRRTKGEIAADIEKYKDERATIARSRTSITGPSMSAEEWLHDSDDSTGFWAWSAESRRLRELSDVIDVLTSEQERPM